MALAAIVALAPGAGLAKGIFSKGTSGTPYGREYAARGPEGQLWSFGISDPWA